ncbi:MAG: hypothetical protein V1787_05870 [Candidatus Micrarchaeota archaeon]
MARLRSQAVFFDGILFLLVVIFSISMVFVALNAYTNSQDRTLSSAYVMNYQQSVTKALYYVDVASMALKPGVSNSQGGGVPVKDYCHDLSGGDNAKYYCKNSAGTAFEFVCSKLAPYPMLTTVMDLVKKDVSDPEGVRMLNDKFGNADQHGKTALRCAMKEFMKPFTFSGYHYLAEITEAPAGSTGETPILPYREEGTDFDKKYASDVMFAKEFSPSGLSASEMKIFQEQFDCSKVNSAQLMSMRSPFTVLVAKTGSSLREGFMKKNMAFRVCLWPSTEQLA